MPSAHDHSFVFAASQNERIHGKCTIVTYVLERTGHRVKQLSVNVARQCRGGIAAVDHRDTLESAGSGLLEEVIATLGLGFNDLCEFGDGLPCFVSAICWSVSGGRRSTAW